MQNITRTLAFGFLGVGLVLAASVRAEEAKASRSSAGPAVTARLAVDKATPDYKQVSFGSGILFVSDRVEISASDVAASREIDSAGGRAMELTLIPSAAGRVVDLAKWHPDQRLAIFVGDRVVAAPMLTSGLAKGVTLIAPMGPTGPTINVTSVQATAKPGDLVSFDVFLTSVPSLRGFQIALDAVGSAGRFDLVDVHVDTARADFAFGTDQIVNAGDLQKGRLVAALFAGERSLTGTAYLGTFTYRVSPDASGAFQVKVRANEDTALRNGSSSAIPFQAGTQGMVTIGGASK